MTGARRYTAMVPTQLTRYLDTAPDALGSFDAIVIGGASMGAELKARAAAAGVTAIPAYGMTETGSGCVYAGLPLDGTELALDDGRILIKGPTLFSGYRLQPALTKEVLQDGWFRTQDRGRFVDGRLEVVGRVDDVVISGGVNMTLTAVQARLLEHPDVADAVVLGVPDQEWGSRVVAFVVGKAELESCRTTWPRHCPAPGLRAKLVRLDELPMLGSGKVDRQRLLDGCGDHLLAGAQEQVPRDHRPRGHAVRGPGRLGGVEPVPGLRRRHLRLLAPRCAGGRRRRLARAGARRRSR